MSEQLTQKRPLVSIGVPTYNRPDMLDRTLERVCAQTWQELEIIVSDNASTDPRSAEVIEKWVQRDPRVRAHRQPSNQGPLPNFYFVLQQANAEWFMWAADDDYLAPWFVERCMQVLLSDERNVLCTAETQYVHNDGSPMSALPQGEAYRKPSGLDRLGRMTYLLRHNFDNLIYGLFRKDALIHDGQILWNVTSSLSNNEIPPLLLAAMRGEIIVLPEAGIYKTAAPSVWAQAEWEERGGVIPATSRIRNMASLRATWRYHDAVIQGITHALGQLNLPEGERKQLASIARKRILKHFVWMVVRYKPPKPRLSTDDQGQAC
ncbi:MAG: glycosyltransferase family 2 protein [Rhodocyclaceae bacterium]|nr:glycosyltransferase family 2 protein [Rhodocyclaceae bacterium]